MATSALFSPLQVGAITVRHRVVLAPLTRLRANSDGELGELGVQYYTQRASFPGTLLITEGSIIHPRAGGWLTAPGIYSEGQIAAWKKITDSVHEKGSFIFLQICGFGRVADSAYLKAKDIPRVGPSAIAADGHPVPRAMTKEEIKDNIQLFATAASNAVHKAGFDGVEIHCANGYLLDQFVQANSNQRTDEYGGSIENRLRFVLEVAAAVAAAVGEEKTGLRVSPWSRFQNMRMAEPLPTFVELARMLKAQHPNFAYLHVVEPRISGSQDDEASEPTDSNKRIRDAWAPGVYIAAGGYNRESATKTVEEDGGLVAFGRHFIPNPDLPSRFNGGINLAPYDRAAFYSPGPRGYVDYPFAALVSP
ncbi:NADH:flavin oxidoreductase/NADH oxidase [Auriscalpium vulgare]|uniref:NADH:flavin oxidoreductase/NADH oxidase n=1 Tax=Auriscalpium vulgare TaxID=40419 RepID=A0ACB8S0T3_9AGAM|nr:NADH:flavin oxidoreductase/NADH oxidase [Auriscalpium vulgare]